jgi:hypothetical protein
MEHQYLIGLIVRDVLLLRFRPLQRNMPVQRLTVTQDRCLLQIFTDGLCHSPNLCQLEPFPIVPMGYHFCPLLSMTYLSFRRLITQRS